MALAGLVMGGPAAAQTTPFNVTTHGTASNQNNVANASTAIDRGCNSSGCYMLVADNGRDVITLHRYASGFFDPTTNTWTVGTPASSTAHAAIWDVRAWLQLPALPPAGNGTKMDIEGSFRSGSRIYWIASMSNSSAEFENGMEGVTSGSRQPSRLILFATDVGGTSPSSTTLTFVGRYGSGTLDEDDPGNSNLRKDLKQWFGTTQALSDFYGFGYASANGFAPDKMVHCCGSLPNGAQCPNPLLPSSYLYSKMGLGINVEGFALGPDGTAYVAFRTPLMSAVDPAVNACPGLSSYRYYTLVIPITNIDQLVTGNPQTTTRARFGAPILLDLGSRGIRSMERVTWNTGDGRTNAAYIIVAGPAIGTGSNDAASQTPCPRGGPFQGEWPHRHTRNADGSTAVNSSLGLRMKNESGTCVDFGAPFAIFSWTGSTGVNSIREFAATIPTRDTDAACTGSFTPQDPTACVADGGFIDTCRCAQSATPQSNGCGFRPEGIVRVRVPSDGLGSTNIRARLLSDDGRLNTRCVFTFRTFDVQLGSTSTFRSPWQGTPPVPNPTPW